MISSKLVLGPVPRSFPGAVRLAAIAGMLGCLLLAGCSLSPMARHAVAFSTATNAVIDSSEDAYRASNTLREREQMVAAVYAYDKEANWSPYTSFAPLLTPEQLEARIDVLDALRAYAGSLVQITGTPSKQDVDALSDAAAGVGKNLQGLSSTVSTKFDKAIPQLSSTQANVVSTAMYALGQYLINRKIRGTLPKVTGDMNNNVKTLCELLKSDITVLQRQADVDYSELLRRQNQFIRNNQLDAAEKRAEVRELILLAIQQKASNDLLGKLHDAVNKLELTHDALTAAAQGNHQESLREKIVELQAAGGDLANFYKSLSSAE